MEKPWKSTIAGILDIIVGAMGLIAGVLLILSSELVGLLNMVDWSSLLNEMGGGWNPGALDLAERLPEVLSELPFTLLIAGLIILILGIIALVGGIFSLRRIRWGFALAGSIIALIIGNVLGLLAIIFVAIGKNEFS